MKEIWKDIEGYEGLYKVSNFGRIKSFKYKSERILKVNYDKQGYLLVHLCKNGIRSCKKVHRLVAETFVTNKNGKKYVNHIDGNKQNNCVNNLEWVTPSENNVHAYKNNLHSITKPMKGKFGKENPTAKIVVQIDKENGEIINEYYRTMEANRKTGIAQANISACCIGKYKTAGGYIWKYKEQKSTY